MLILSKIKTFHPFFLVSLIYSSYLCPEINLYMKIWT